MFKNYKPLEFFSIIAAVLFVVGWHFYSGTDPLSGSGNCEQTAYTDRKWICDHDSDYLLVFRNYPVYTGQSAQAGF